MVSLKKWFILKIKAIFKLRMTLNFKGYPKTAHNFLGRTTLKKGSAEVPFFKLRVL